ncbi:MAG: AAA family ATPase [Pseudomonadota bacterium]
MNDEEVLEKPAAHVPPVAVAGTKLEEKAVGASISAFDKIKGLGVFPNFVWPSGLEHFKTFNLFYGWNGCGKTTLSRLLRYLEDNKFLPEDWYPEFKSKTSTGYPSHYSISFFVRSYSAMTDSYRRF